MRAKREADNAARLFLDGKSYLTAVSVSANRSKSTLIKKAPDRARTWSAEPIGCLH